jgi:acetyl-CoA carboxylase biotin carboxyl carrier protein
MPKAKLAADSELIRQLAALIDETGLTEIEIEHDGQRIRVARRGFAAVEVAQPVASTPPVVPETPVIVDPSQHPGVITSPMVGTAYWASEPGARPFVEVGSHVKVGDTLLIIEAMKTMNQIPAPRAGIVTRILIEDGHPVEYGEPLMIIE